MQFFDGVPVLHGLGEEPPPNPPSEFTPTVAVKSANSFVEHSAVITPGLLDPQYLSLVLVTSHRA